MGLDDLVGPGAWDTHEDKVVPQEPVEAPPTEPEKTEPVANGTGKHKGNIESGSTPSGWQIEPR
jgi:hypothetical protein